MTDEPQGAVETTDANDTAAVLAIASGEKTYIGADAEPTDQGEGTGDDTTSGTDAPAAADEGQAEKPKPKQTVQERIDELTRARREAERDRDFYKEQALRGGKPPEDKPAPVAQQGSDEPDPDDFTHGMNDLDYVRALARYEARQEFAERSQAEQARQTVTSKISAFDGRMKELYPDGEPEGITAFRALPEVSQPMTEVILASDIGPKIADHLGANPAEFERLSGLSPALQARELTLLESRLAPEAKPAPKTTTDAPEPPPQARGAGGQFKVAADTSDFAAFEKQYRIGG